MNKNLAQQLRHAALSLASGKSVDGIIELLNQAADALYPAAQTKASLSATGVIPAALVLEADGGSRGNPGPAGAGAVLRDQNGLVLNELSRFLGIATNNVAEYQALLMGLKAALAYKPDKLLIRLDSELLVKQLNGAYQVKSEHLKPLYLEAKSLLAGFPRVEITHIPRALNSLADALANQAMDTGN